MFNFKPYFITALCLALPAAPGLAQDVARPAKVFTVEEDSGKVSRTYPAIVLPSEEVELSFRVSGRVLELPIRGSMQVAKGDVIAQLDLRDFQTQVAQLESQRDQAAAQLAELKAGLLPEEIAALEAAVASAQAQYDQALEQAERTRQLVERNVASQATLDTDEANLRVADANLEAQKEQLALGQLGARDEEVAAGEAALGTVEAQLQVARNNLADATLVAPFDGMIGRRDIDNFTNIQAGQTVALLQKLEPLHLTFDVPGPDVTVLTAGGVDQIVNTASFDAIDGDPVVAEVVEFALQADASTQTYRGRVAVPQPEDVILLPGMAGQVTATAAAEAQAMRIPITALAATPDSAPFVWVVGADNTVSRRDVTLGEAKGDKVQVLDGLQPGEQVIAAGVSQIQDGMEIRPFTRFGG
ncbi:efflux RND transporter periplasmic adaptor subunit [Epibacterium ulvae]|uniref:efflux RND transporter periplasmic adaptor subunit n=1 Tax=Epibacterium ulvae TaxID=1156985 RepID=UPI001BFC6EE3|nr:efflux RND transporter periplasmic adaptor subunit [Epibacterium ulvae]MBT8153050.1 efflux RND transporter periplasmic adaptor subunit [Epibacterium ulvae]